MPLAAFAKARAQGVTWFDKPFVLFASFWPSTDNLQRQRHVKTMTLQFSLGAISWVAATMRAEVALLVGGLALALALRGHRSIFATASCVGLVGLLGGAYEWMASRPYWGRSTWAELEGIIFNVLQGKSSDWGVSRNAWSIKGRLADGDYQVSPWHTYITAHLPKLLMFSLPLAMFAFIDPRARRSLHGWRTVIVLPATIMVLGMSCLGHKEWRFIAYVVPLVNVIAAFGASSL